MVNHSTATLDATFAALADPTRRALLTRLAAGESSVMTLAAPFAVSLPAITKHLRVLERAGLVRSRRQGRVRRVQLVARPMKDAVLWLTRYRRFWEHALDRLTTYLSESTEDESPWPKAPKRPPPGFSSAARSRRRAKKSSRRGRGPKR